MLKIANRPKYWVFYLLIPLIGLFIYFGVVREFLRAYGRTSIIDQIAGFLLPFIYFPYLGFSKDVKYVGLDTNEKTQDAVREWSEAIGFAVIAATLIRWL